MPECGYYPCQQPCVYSNCYYPCEPQPSLTIYWSDTGANEVDYTTDTLSDFLLKNTQKDIFSNSALTKNIGTKFELKNSYSTTLQSNTIQFKITNQGTIYFYTDTTSTSAGWFKIISGSGNYADKTGKIYYDSANNKAMVYFNGY